MYEFVTPEKFGQLQKQPPDTGNLLKSHYQFRCQKIPNVVYFCQNAVTPSQTLPVVSQFTNFNPIQRSGGVINQSNLTIKFLISEDLSNYKEILNWMRECTDYIDFDEYTPPDEHMSRGVLFILDRNNQPRHKFVVDGIFPVSLTSLEFSTEDTKSEYHYATAEFALTSYQIENV